MDLLVLTEFEGADCLMISEVKLLIEVARERKMKQGEDLSELSDLSFMFLYHQRSRQGHSSF